MDVVGRRDRNYQLKMGLLQPWQFSRYDIYTYIYIYNAYITENNIDPELDIKVVTNLFVLNDY